MTSEQKKAAKEIAAIVKNTANHLNVMRVRLEEIAGDAFLEASTCGQALSEEVRLFDGGNDRLAGAVHTVREALAFYGELLGENFGEETETSGDDRRAALRKKSPTCGEVPAPIGRALDPTYPQQAGKSATSPRPAVRHQRGEGEQKKARCETCKFCAFPRTSDDNGGACKCKLLRRKTIDVLVVGGDAPAWCPLNERGGVKL